MKMVLKRFSIKNLDNQRQEETGRPEGKILDEEGGQPGHVNWTV